MAFVVCTFISAFGSRIAQGKRRCAELAEKCAIPLFRIRKYPVKLQNCGFHSAFLFVFTVGCFLLWCWFGEVMEVILKRSLNCWKKLDEMLVERLKGLGDPVVSSVGMPSASPSPFPLPAPLPPCVSLLHPSSNPPAKRNLFQRNFWRKRRFGTPKFCTVCGRWEFSKKNHWKSPPGVGSGGSRINFVLPLGLGTYKVLYSN